MEPILIVDDEEPIAALIRRTLTGGGYPCVAVTDSRLAADLVERNRYELVLLDIMMPGVDGYDLLRYIRPTGTPVIFLTAKAALEDRVQGLHQGADDYIVKPFAPAELLARVEAVLRRTGRGMAVLRTWDVTVDTARQQVTKNGAPVELTPKEYELLLLLLRNRGRALYRDYILETVWGLDAELDTARTVDTHIRRLRRKLGWDSQIETVWRVGYCLQPEGPKQEVPR